VSDSTLAVNGTAIGQALAHRRRANVQEYVAGSVNKSIADKTRLLDWACFLQKKILTFEATIIITNWLCFSLMLILSSKCDKHSFFKEDEGASYVLSFSPGHRYLKVPLFITPHGGHFTNR